MTRILIAVDGSERSGGAIALGRALALAAGASVTLATVHPPEPIAVRRSGNAYDGSMREAAEATLARLSVALGDVGDVDLRPLANKSAAHALQETAEQEGVGLIVVGSSHAGRLGRVLLGTTAERLLHGAPCPVAFAPNGYRAVLTPEHPVVGCAYRSTEDGEAALGAAEELALALEGSLRVMLVVEPMPHVYDAGEMPLNLPEMNASFRAEAEQSLTARVAHLSSQLQAGGTVYGGKPADVLITLSETVDMMVIGSRGYGPRKAVLLGGVSGQVIRSARCPVVVVPRGAPAAVGSVFASVKTPRRGERRARECGKGSSALVLGDDGHEVARLVQRPRWRETPVALWHLCTSARPPASARLDPIPSDDRTDGVPAEDNKQTLINADSTLATFTIGAAGCRSQGGPRVRA
jgi:nucleotide-binding universal stress UspA family protein